MNEEEKSMISGSVSDSRTGPSVTPSVRPSEGITGELPAEGRRRAPTFREAWDAAAEQVGLRAIQKLRGDCPDTQVMVIIVRCMADVYCRAPSASVRIGGEDMMARDVQDVYRLIGCGDVNELIAKVRRVSPRSAKAYIQTALWDAGLTAGLSELVDWEEIEKEAGLTAGL